MSKSIQDRIKDISEYSPEINFKDGGFVINIAFDEKWNILPPENANSIAYSIDDNRAGRHWYVSSIDDADLVFDLIEDTIAINKELEKKIELYHNKVAELQKLFLSEIPYEKLANLQFTFDNSQKQKNSRKKAKQKLDEVKDSNTVDSPEDANCKVSVDADIQVEDEYNTIEDPTIMSETDSEIDNKIAKAIEQ